MSKLSFVETNEFGVLEDVSDGYASSEPEGTAGENHLALNSYDIMGVESCTGVSGVKVRQRRQAVATTALAQTTSWEDEDDEAEQSVAPVIANSPSSGTQPQGDSIETTDALSLSAAVTTVPKVSKWLQGFLQQKKEAGQTPAKPEIIPMNDMFIAQFADSTRTHLAANRSAEKDTDDGSVSDSGSSTDSQEGHYDPTGLSKSLFEDVKERIDFDKIQLKFFNLPYNMNAEEIERKAKEYGVVIRNVEIHIDRSTKLPRGSATVELTPASDADDGEEIDADGALQALVGADFNGRPLRVERYGRSDKNKSRKSSVGGSRYFGGSLGISVKCSLCGEVGHMQADCIADPVVPCHLCTRADHDPADCPNIICYRCGEFGHHSKTCTSYFNNERPSLCTACGGTTHDNRGCRKRLGAPNLEKLEGPAIVCMVCKKMGHALCHRTLRPPNRDIFCPSCGEKGHHCDFPDLGRVTCRFGGGGGGRYSDSGGRGMGINYNSGREVDYDRRGSSGGEYNKRRRPDSDSDSDEIESYMRDLSRSSGRTVTAVGTGDTRRDRPDDSYQRSNKRSRRSY